MALSLFEKAVLEDARKTFNKGKGGGAAAKANAGTEAGAKNLLRALQGNVNSYNATQTAGKAAVKAGGVIPEGTALGGRLRAAQAAINAAKVAGAAPEVTAVVSKAAPAATRSLGPAAMLAMQGYNAGKLFSKGGRDEAMQETEDILRANEKRAQDIEASAPAPEDRDFYDKAGILGKKAASDLGTFVKLNLRGMTDPAGVVGTLAGKYMQTGSDMERANAADDMYTAQIKGKQEYNKQKKQEKIQGEEALRNFDKMLEKTTPYRSTAPEKAATKEGAPSLGATTEYLSQTLKAADDQRMDREEGMKPAAKEEAPMRAIPVQEADDLFMTATGTPFDPKSALDRKRMASITSFLQSRPELADMSNTKKSLAYYTSLANNKRKM